MDIETAEVELYLRKYRWAIADFTREVENGCPLLSILPDPSAQRFLIYMHQFSIAERLEIATLLLKSWYRPAIQLLGEPFTQAENTKANGYRTELRNMVLPVVYSSSPITKAFAVKRTDVAKTVLPILSLSFGSKPEKVESLHWCYSLPVGEWCFCTSLDFGGTWGTEIRCFHRLVRSDSRNWGFVMMTLPSTAGTIRVSQSFSLLSLYGLSNGTYSIDSAEDVQKAAQAIHDVYNRLLQTVPAWVEKLTIT